jgi:5-methylcytosine-specific restriction endonuclease McrA
VNDQHGGADMASITEKKCTKCGEVKNISMFGKLKIGKNGLMPHCKECDKKKSRQWQKDNPERTRAIKRKWLEANPEKARISVREYRDRNILYSLVRVKQWQKNNPEKMAIIKHARRANVLKNGGTYTVSEWLDLCGKYNYKCLRCEKTGIKLTVDHVIPLSKGGKNSIDNIQPLCKPCNSSKGAKTDDYR